MIAERSAPGGFVYEDDLFVATIPDKTPVPGWLIVSLKRHELPLTSRLSDAEAAALGPLLRRLVAAAATAVNAERVYNTLFGEGAAHWHMLVATRTSEIPPQDRQVDLIRSAARYSDLDRALRAADAIRAELADHA